MNAAAVIFEGRAICSSCQAICILLLLLSNKLGLQVASRRHATAVTARADPLALGLN
jgi:hypothetical protein